MNASKPREEPPQPPQKIKIKKPEVQEVKKPEPKKARSPPPEPIETKILERDCADLESPEVPKKKREAKPKNDDPRLLRVQNRNESGDNAMLNLGGGLIESSRGKAQIANVRAKQLADKNEYYDFHKSHINFSTHNQQQYPAYNDSAIKTSNDLSPERLREEVPTKFTEPLQKDKQSIINHAG